jgi:hypothetical protein
LSARHYIYENTIEIPKYLSQEELLQLCPTSDLCTLVSTVATFNLALAYQLSAEDKTRDPQSRAQHPEGLPPKATTVSVQWDQQRKHDNAWIGVSTYDAMLNAFRRDFVPFIFPYATLEPGASEHVSQGVVWCIMMTCAPSSVVFVPNMGIKNTMHREYIRTGLTKGRIKLNIQRNYMRYMNLNPYCTKHELMDQRDWIGPFSSAREFNDHVPTPKTNDECSPIANRFSDWEASILSTSASSTRQE